MPNPQNSSKKHHLKFSYYWSEPHPATYGCIYLNQRDYKPRFGIEQAIICLLSPVGMALSGKSAQEVEVAIAKSQSLFNSYMYDARHLVDAQSGHRPEIFGSGSSLSNGHQSPALAPVAVGPVPVVEEDERIDMEHEDLLNLGEDDDDLV